MKKVTIFLLFVLTVSTSYAQERKHFDLSQQARIKPPVSAAKEVGVHEAKTGNYGFPSNSLPESVSVPGTTDLGIITKWDLQTNGGPLHNVQVDPSNPMNIHACIMAAPNVTENDTTTSNFYPSRRMFYTFSSDGGTTWKTPTAISTLRSGYGSMILIKRGSDYIPVIAAHHNETETGSNVLTALYIEKGVPGAGNFKEVNADRTTFEGGAADIIWPYIVQSKDGTKIFVVASVFTTTTAGFTYLQFGTYTLNETKDDATWGGWKQGPSTDNTAISNGGVYVIHVSAGGKLGMAWKNDDVGDPDLGVYFAESNDDGATWAGTTSVYSPYDVGSLPADDNGNPIKLIPGGGIDFVYDGETPQIVFGAFPQAAVPGSTSGVYYPSLGSLMYWHPGLTNARILISRLQDPNLPVSPELDASFLSNYPVGTMIYTTSANLSNPSISLTGGAGKWSIYFGAWANDDSGSVAEFSDGTNTYNAVAYGSVWKTTTLNGGSTWTDADMVVGNAPDISQDQKLDFHFPSTSTFNPASSSSTDEYLVFAADTCGGLHQEGYVGFSDVHYLMKKVTVNAVRKDGQPNSVITNYPNPVISGNATTITFSLQNASDVNLVVTDVLGRTVAQLSEGKLSGGAHEISFTTKNLSPGVYNYSIRAGSETAYGAMNVIR